MLKEARLNARSWEYAIQHWAYEKNPCFNHASIVLLLKYSWESNLHRNISDHLAVWRLFTPKTGNQGFIQIQSQGLILDCDDNGIYTFDCLGDKKILNSVHVSFDEGHFPRLDNYNSSSSEGESQKWSERENGNLKNRGSTQKQRCEESSDRQSDLFDDNFNTDRTTLPKISLHQMHQKHQTAVHQFQRSTGELKPNLPPGQRGKLASHNFTVYHHRRIRLS